MKMFFDWAAVFSVVFISTVLATFLIDPSPVAELKWADILGRGVILAGATTGFYIAVTWLRREGSTVPEDIRQKLPDDPTGGATQ